MPVTKLTYSQTRQIRQYHPETVTLDYVLAGGETVPEVYAVLRDAATRLLYGDQAPDVVPAEPVRSAVERPATDNQRTYLFTLARDLGWDLAEVAGRYGYDLDALSMAQASTLINHAKGALVGRHTPSDDPDELPF